MRRKRSRSVLLSVLALAAGAASAATPTELAEDLASLIVSGAGVLMPDLSMPHIEDRGVQTLPNGPTDFLSGLVPVSENGITVYPVSIRIDEATGDAVFYNADGAPFHLVPRVGPANWLSLCRPLLVSDNPWYAPDRVVAVWTLVPEESLDDYLATMVGRGAPAHLPVRGRSTPSFMVTNLMFTALSVTASNVVLEVAWPAEASPPDGILDLYFSPTLAPLGLSDPHGWMLLDTTTASSPSNATFTVDGALLTNFLADATAHVHDETCVPITNIVAGVFLPGEPVTNVTYSCATNPPGPAASGFFRAGTRLDTDDDGLTDAFETMVSRTSRWLSDTDGDGLSDYDEVHVYVTDPRSVDSDGDGLSDGQEISRGTSPILADTDGDGLGDILEILEYGTDEKRTDTDGDGLSDAEEVLVHHTSPFSSDTENDGLTDGREILELHSNPLSWDTDSDGIDDSTEYAGRNYGFNLLDASDAAEDQDGDAFLNLQEIQTGYSPFYSASSNDVPRLKLLRIHPLESPKVSSSTIYTQLLALGDNDAKGSKIRIPRSTQYGTTNLVRRLHYTDAPGIFLGNHSLAGGGTLEFPDSQGDIELTVHSSPEFGGTVATLTLEGANIVSPSSATLAVPAMSGATLRFSNISASSPAGKTNLVNGVLGTIAVGHYDPDYGMPRFSLDPTIVNDNSTGHRGLWCTDLVLVKVSGATNLTTTANYLRWDSVHPSRRGQELPVGISRIEAGLDFDFDGELDDGEIAVSCDVHVVRVALLSDADRDGTFGNADGPLRNRWATDAGALLAVDDPPGTVAASRVAGAESPLSPLFVLSPSVVIPEGYHLDLKFSSSPSRRRIYTSGYTNALDISGAYVVTQGLAKAEIANGRAFYVSSTLPAAASSVQPEATVSLRLMRGVTPVATDSVVLKIPPLIIPWNTLPLTRLWTCDLGDLGRFPASVAADRQMCLSTTTNGYQWAQDIIQTFAFQKDTAHGWQTAFADLGHPHAGTFPLDVTEASAMNNPACLFQVSNGGNGGNVEATPPLPGYPYGRLLTGTNSSGRVCRAVEVAEAQGLQGPAIKLPVGWLAVGHVDEVCCFIGERTVMVPSPRLAFDLIAQEVVAHDGNYTNTIVWYDGTTNYIHRMQDILFDKVVTNANWATDLTASATVVFAPLSDYAANDVLYCDGELMHVSEIIEQDNGMAEVTLDRGYYDTIPMTHSSNSMILKVSLIGSWNIRRETHLSDFLPANNLQFIRKKLCEEIDQLSVVEIPVLYQRYTIGSRTVNIAGTPNMVNAVVDGSTIYMTDPGCDLFRNAVNVPGKVFVGGHDVWTLYHCNYGELHCGSEAERAIPVSPPWWQEPEFENWPYEMKEMTQ